MTLLGEYLLKKSIKKADVSRKTGLSQSRLSELTLNTSSKLRVDELYLIALAIDTNPCEIMQEICKNLTLKSTD